MCLSSEFVSLVSAGEQGLPWFSDLANYLADGVMLKGLTYQ